jgi:carbamoyltransferase
MNILGIHYGHNATVALMREGQIIFVCSEERFNRIKNSTGFPYQTLEYIYRNLIKPEEIDLVVIFQKNVGGYFNMKKRNFKAIQGMTLFDYPKTKLIHRLITPEMRSSLGRLHIGLNTWKDSYTQESHAYFAQVCQVPKEKVIYSDHHQSHAYAAGLSLDPAKKYLVFTIDGEGDGVSSTVNIWNNFSLERISSSPVSSSLGYFYAALTEYLGMRSNEHEFKVMGLAPYAKPEKVEKLYNRLQDLIEMTPNFEFVAKIPMQSFKKHLFEKLKRERFDVIAGFTQLFLESKVVPWVKAWISKTGISDVALGGGVAMNVKLNQKIFELSEVSSIYPMPSAGDESTPIGAAFYGYLELCKTRGITPNTSPLKDLYLGNEYSHQQIKDFLNENNYQSKYKVEEMPAGAIEKKVAMLLSQHKIVARFSGRMEWGARALGNRSILAHPGSQDTVRVINEMIKNRDFWMPFAATILEEDQDKYLINPKRILAPYMAITFNTTPLAREHLTATIHPYDFTCRPQVLKKDWNPLYYELIEEFKKLTGVAAVLNTSFNLHGEPNVESPKDAMHTFEDSGLEYLALGNFLISKV